MPRRRKSGTHWSQGAKNTLRRMAKDHASTERIAKTVKRTKSAVRAQASRLDISLMPKD